MTSPRSKLLVPTILTVAGVGVAAGAAYLARQRKGDVKDFVVSRVLEAPASRSSYTDLAQSLERAGGHLAGRAARATDTPANRDVLAHIITIERWGQNRLRVALRERTYERDESSAYRPAQTLGMDDLRALLSSTRARTVELARQLHRHPPQDDVTVDHNGLGPLTAKAWLRYLTQHADLESRRLRGGQDAQGVHEQVAS